MDQRAHREQSRVGLEVVRPAGGQLGLLFGLATGDHNFAAPKDQRGCLRVADPHHDRREPLCGNDTCAHQLE